MKDGVHAKGSHGAMPEMEFVCGDFTVLDWSDGMWIASSCLQSVRPRIEADNICSISFGSGFPPLCRGRLSPTVISTSHVCLCFLSCYFYMVSGQTLLCWDFFSGGTSFTSASPFRAEGTVMRCNPPCAKDVSE